MFHIAYKHFRGMLHVLYLRSRERDLIGSKFSLFVIGISSLYVIFIFSVSVWHLFRLPEDKTFFVILFIMLLYNTRLIRCKSYLGF